MTVPGRYIVGLQKIEIYVLTEPFGTFFFFFTAFATVNLENYLINICPSNQLLSSKKAAKVRIFIHCYLPAQSQGPREEQNLAKT